MSKRLKRGHRHTRRVPLAEWPPEVSNPDPEGEGTVPADAQTLANMGLWEIGRTDTHVIVACSRRDEWNYHKLPGEIVATDKGRPGARYDRLPAAVKAVVMVRRVWRRPADEIPDIQPGERGRVREHVRGKEEAGEETSIRLLTVPAAEVREDDIADDDGTPSWPIAFAGEQRRRR